MPDDTSHAADEERLRKILRMHMHRWSVSPTDEPELFFVLRLLDARDAALRGACTPLDAAEPDEWRPDRPGWYWVKRSFEEDTWRPAHWIVTPECTGWEGYTHPEEIVEIGRYIPAPPAVSEEGGG